LFYGELVALVPIGAPSSSPELRGMLRDIWPDGVPADLPPVDHTTRLHYFLAGELAERFCSS